MAGAVIVWGWDAANTEYVRALVDAAGHLQVDVLSSALSSVRCYGYDGAAWQTLLVESAANPNLRVGLYYGASEAVIGDYPNTFPATTHGLHTIAALYAHDLTNYRRLNTRKIDADGFAVGTYCLETAGFLYGYNGASWDRLRIGTPADAFATPTYALEVMSFLMGYDGADWNMVRVDASGHVQVDVLSSALPALAATAANQALILAALDFGGNVYSKTMTMADDNPTRFEAASKKLRDIVIIVKTHPMLLGETGVEVYPVDVGETVGFTKVDISTLWFQNANAGKDGVITILGVEE